MTNLDERDLSRKTNRKFTSIKMDWNAALAYDPRLKHAHFRVGFVMMQYANEAADNPWRVWPSQKTIAHEAGRMSVRYAQEAIDRLVETKWLHRHSVWRGGKTHNSYTLLFDNVQAILEVMAMERQARKKKQRHEPGFTQTPILHSTRKTLSRDSHNRVRASLAVIDGGRS
jgi:hypothetical protein